MHEPRAAISRRVRHAFNDARTHPTLQNKWITADLLKDYLNSLIDGRPINTGDLNRSMRDNAFGFSNCENLTSTNTDGIFRMVCGKEFIYYITYPGGSCIQPDNLNAAFIGKVKISCEQLRQNLDRLLLLNYHLKISYNFI